MAILFVDSLSRKKNKVFLSAVKALEVMLLSAGLISTLIMVIKKGAIIPYSCELVFSSLIGFWNSVKCFFFSSPLHICIIINFMVVLIVESRGLKRNNN
ncbi:hypothetical protein ACJIZ3_010041 [Penstemon smallii]|uniref:Uncharacterized protein n=1 Tax=Penstemon smallii TaxID=265156 RepID=A0ABD3TF37_9LAMI